MVPLVFGFYFCFIYYFGSHVLFWIFKYLPMLFFIKLKFKGLCIIIPSSIYYFKMV